MMQRIPFGSPAKQNLPSSPTKKRKLDPLIQIINYLKTTSINLPPHIARILSSNPESPLKQVHQQQLQDQDKKLRVRLSQCEFQLKKIEEDFAEYKRQVKIEKEKEGKKNQDQISKLKSSIQNGMEDSAYKLHKAQQKHEEEIRVLREKHRLELEQQTNKIQIALQHKIYAQEKLRRRQTSQIQRNSDRKLAETVKVHEQVISALQKRFQDEISELKMRHKSIIQDKQRRHESIRVAIESQRRTQQKLHEKTKVQSSKQREKLICELCFQKNMRSQLEQDIELKEKQIRKLKNQINDKQVDLQLSEQKAAKRLEEAKTDYEKRILSAEKQYEDLAKQLLKAQFEQLSSIQTRIKELQSQHQKQIELLSLNADQIANNFQLRPSKPQDLSQIEKLKWALAKKDDEARKLKNDLKHCNLELENKEEIYTRIFRGNSMSREKRNPFKQDREQAVIEQKLGRQTIFRKSQTADVKYLLKIYNNTKNA